MPHEPVNHRFFDRFSLVHAAVGAVAELSAIPAPVAIGASVLFEVAENPIKRNVSHIWPDNRPDGFENQLGDVASVAAGYYLARAVKTSPVGAMAIVLLAAVAGGIWTNSLLPQNQVRALR